MSSAVEVLMTLPVPDKLLAQLEEISPRLRITVMPARKADDIPNDIWNRTEVLYTVRVLPAPELVPNLRWIQFHFAGIDFAAQSPLLNQPELQFTTLSGAATSQMSEYAVMMMLALGHRVPDLMTSQIKSDWPRERWERFSPLELRGSTVGIVGYGSIGRQIARLLQPFGVTILAAKRDAMHPEDTGYTPENLGDPDGTLFRRLYPTQALRPMLKECDFIVITAPLTPETQHLIGQEELEVCKPTAFLIDISRGGIVDQQALIETLQNHKLGGAAMDVFPEEPLPSSSPLWKIPNVIITPHIAGNSPRYTERAMSLFAENLNRYLVGLGLYNRFDSQRGY